MSTPLLTKTQKKTFSRVFHEDRQEYIIIAKVRYDDECGNGHNTFSITGEIWKARNGKAYGRDCESCGCIHEGIAKHFPELAPLLKWHLTSSDGPMHYIENTAYWAGKRGFKDGKPGSPPNLDHARSSAVWPKADDKDFTDPGLEERLEARLPQLMAEFQAAVEGLGFTF